MNLSTARLLKHADTGLGRKLEGQWLIMLVNVNITGHGVGCTLVVLFVLNLAHCSSSLCIYQRTQETQSMQKRRFPGPWSSSRLNFMDCTLWTQRGQAAIAMLSQSAVPRWSPPQATCWIYLRYFRVQLPGHVNSQLVAFRQLEFLILLCYICSVNKQLDFHIAGMITLKLTSLP